MSFRNNLSLLVRAMLSPLGFRLIRLKPNKVRGLDPLLDLKWLVRNKQNPVIFDVGANDGETAKEMLKHFPEARIVAFEPFEDCYQLLQQTFSGKPNVRVENIALGDVVEDRNLNVYSGNRMNSLLTLDEAPENMMKGKFVAMGTAPVEVHTLDKFCEENGFTDIDILKVDTQGFDFRVLRGGERLLKGRRVKALLLELNFVPMYKGQASFVQIHELLASYGYRLVDIYNQVITDDYVAWCDACYVATGKPANGVATS